MNKNIPEDADLGSIRILNLTCGDVAVDLTDDGVLAIPRMRDELGTPRIARAVRVPWPDDPIELGSISVPTTSSRLMGVSGLPDPTEDTWILVTEEVAEAAHHSGRDCSDLLVCDVDHRGRETRRTLRRWSPTCSLRVHLDDLRRRAQTMTLDKAGYAALDLAMDDEVARKASEVASCLLASMAPAPGNPVRYAHRALAVAVELSRISQEREDARRITPEIDDGEGGRRDGNWLEH
jgi:hypothetical protein